MHTAQQTLDETFLEMRWRLLSLAADLDRIQRAAGSESIWRDDPRLKDLRKAMEMILGDAPDRAERMQMIFSDVTPPPSVSRDYLQPAFPYYRELHTPEH